MVSGPSPRHTTVAGLRRIPDARRGRVTRIVSTTTCCRLLTRWSNRPQLRLGSITNEGWCFQRSAFQLPRPGDWLEPITAIGATALEAVQRHERLLMGWTGCFPGWASL